jgi:hypothetical protein
MACLIEEHSFQIVLLILQILFLKKKVVPSDWKLNEVFLQLMFLFIDAHGLKIQGEGP